MLNFPKSLSLSLEKDDHKTQVPHTKQSNKILIFIMTTNWIWPRPTYNRLSIHWQQKVITTEILKVCYRTLAHVINWRPTAKPQHKRSR